MLRPNLAAGLTLLTVAVSCAAEPSLPLQPTAKLAVAEIQKHGGLVITYVARVSVHGMIDSDPGVVKGTRKTA